MTVSTSQSPQSYELPARLVARLEANLPPGAGRAHALRLARFLGRHWALPDKLGQAFHVMRERLAARRPDLGLTQKQIRNAISALEAAGFLKRQPVEGSPYRPTEHGLRRKPILYRFGAEFWSLFRAACAKALRLVGRLAGTFRPNAGANMKRGTTNVVLSGPSVAAARAPRPALGPPAASDERLEGALARLLAGIRSEGGR